MHAASVLDQARLMSGSSSRAFTVQIANFELQFLAKFAVIHGIDAVTCIHWKLAYMDACI